MARQRLRTAVEDAKQRVDAGDAVVLDVVDSETYEQLDSRIAGAVRIDPGRLLEEYERLPRDRAVFAY